MKIWMHVVSFDLIKHAPQHSSMFRLNTHNHFEHTQNQTFPLLLKINAIIEKGYIIQFTILALGALGGIESPEA